MFSFPFKSFRASKFLWLVNLRITSPLLSLLHIGDRKKLHQPNILFLFPAQKEIMRDYIKRLLFSSIVACKYPSEIKICVAAKL